MPATVADRPDGNGERAVAGAPTSTAGDRLCRRAFCVRRTPVRPLPPTARRDLQSEFWKRDPCSRATGFRNALSVRRLRCRRTAPAAAPAAGCAGPARARARAVTAPNTVDTQCDFDLHDGFHAANPAQDDPAAAAGGDLSRSPARHGLAAHRLPGRGERGQVRGGLGAVAPADGTRPARALRTAPRPGPRRRSPPTRSPSHGPPHRTAARRPWAPRHVACHGPPPSSTRPRPVARRRPGSHRPRARFLVRAPRPPGR